MQEIKVYNPFNTKNYYLIKNQDKNYFKYNDYLIEICPNGYIPKSGLLYDMVLNENLCKNKKILDLGCGYLGILSLISKYNGAKKIDSVDYDIECVNWFKKIIQDNNFTNIECFHSNWFSNIKSTDYDLIVTNPPQMPMLEYALHDSGGFDGREYILKILKEAINHLKVSGYLFCLIFDFLGTNVRTNEKESIMEFAEKIGYKDIKIIYEFEKNIMENSVTYNNLDYIRGVYPLYNFDNDGKLKCKIQIMSMRK